MWTCSCGYTNKSNHTTCEKCAQKMPQAERDAIFRGVIHDVLTEFVFKFFNLPVWTSLARLFGKVKDDAKELYDSISSGR